MLLEERYPVELELLPVELEELEELDESELEELDEESELAGLEDDESALEELEDEESELDELDESEVPASPDSAKTTPQAETTITNIKKMLKSLLIFIKPPIIIEF